MDDNEELIEEARRAYLDAWAATNLEDVPPGTRSRNGIIAALAVFEKAQGEPSDAQVEAALDAFRPWLNDGSGFPNIHRSIDRKHMRAALRAAGGVR